MLRLSDLPRITEEVTEKAEALIEEAYNHSVCEVTMMESQEEDQPGCESQKSLAQYTSCINLDELIWVPCSAFFEEIFGLRIIWDTVLVLE